MRSCTCRFEGTACAEDAYGKLTFKAATMVVKKCGKRFTDKDEPKGYK